MKLNRKIYLAIILSSIFIIISVIPAFAWQFTLSNADGSLTEGGTYEMVVDFQGDTTDYLDFLFFAIEWNTDLLAVGDFVAMNEYVRDPGFPQSPYNLWEPTFITPELDIENGRYINVNAATHNDHMREFFPEDTGETQMATFTFTALQTGYFEDLATFYFTPENDLTELVNINDVSYDAEKGHLQITKSGSSSVLSAVPIPGALWLFGTGLMGLFGARFRRMK